MSRSRPGALFLALARAFLAIGTTGDCTFPTQALFDQRGAAAPAAAMNFRGARS